MIHFDWSPYQAVLFDLDGVLTSTASVHAAAWKETFDEALSVLSDAPQPPFDVEDDYLPYVDGRPRYEGVDTFLRSRGIELPWGDASDDPGFETVCALGNLKNQRLTEVLARGGVEAFAGSLRLLDHLDGIGLRQAVVSASANAAAVLDAAGLLDRFPVRVDGVVAREMSLAGKPQPDSFLEAARRLEVAPSSCVVVEDAVAGVQAGVAGGFGAVIGVSRHASSQALEDAGADPVVDDLGELVP